MSGRTSWATTGRSGPAGCLSQSGRVTKRFRGRFLGTSSPVHFFWGACDLALARFSGRPAPEPAERQSPMMREAMSHEEISVGFWPGSDRVTGPAFYAYARPEPHDLAGARIRPEAAYYPTFRMPCCFL